MIREHYTEADLLETYYMPPGESTPVMMHLAKCTDCAARYERLERKLREAAACDAHQQPETFWTRQRLLIMRKIEARGRQVGSVIRPGRIAAGAALAFLLGGAVVYKLVEPAMQAPPVVVTRTAPPVSVAPKSGEELQVPHDPWQSEELQDFHAVVQWESWIADPNNGDRS